MIQLGWRGEPIGAFVLTMMMAVIKVIVLTDPYEVCLELGAVWRAE